MPDSTQPETINVRIPSRLDLLALLDVMTTALCQRMEFDPDTTSQVVMSVIEAGTNAIQHGHKRDPRKWVDIEFQLYEDRIEVEVQDTGPGFDPKTINGDITSPEHLLDARGRGIYIMRVCMDQVDFEFTGSGTACHLVKRRPLAAAST
jgi:anti-sigma regulatory factor (Ser/Thr protein kinase)